MRLNSDVEFGESATALTTMEDAAFFDDFYRREQANMAAFPTKLSEAIEAVLQVRHKLTLNAKVQVQHFGVPLHEDTVRESVLLARAAEMLRLVIDNREAVMPILMARKGGR